MPKDLDPPHFFWMSLQQNIYTTLKFPLAEKKKEESKRASSGGPSGGDPDAGSDSDPDTDADDDEASVKKIGEVLILNCEGLCVGSFDEDQTNVSVQFISMLVGVDLTIGSSDALRTALTGIARAYNDAETKTCENLGFVVRWDYQHGAADWVCWKEFLRTRAEETVYTTLLEKTPRNTNNEWIPNNDFVWENGNCQLQKMSPSFWGDSIGVKNFSGGVVASHVKSWYPAEVPIWLSTFRIKLLS